MYFCVIAARSASHDFERDERDRHALMTEPCETSQLRGFEGMLGIPK
jgi:hypothetical protein